MGQSWVMLNQQVVTSVFLCGNGSFVATAILLLMVKVRAVKKLGVVRCRIQCIILTSRWCDVILNIECRTKK